MTLRTRRSTDIRIGRQRRQLPVLPLLLLSSLVANAWFATKWTPKAGDGTGSLTDAVTAAAGANAGQADGDTTGETAASGVAARPTAGSPTEATTAVPIEPAGPADPVRLVSVVIEGPVASAFVSALGSSEGNRVALTAGRLLVWWLDCTSDPRRGDKVDVLFEVSEQNQAEVLIHALRYESAKLGQTFEAWRFQPPGWAFPSWFDADGDEVPARLVPAPIENFDQITSLVGDGRHHTGMDFKAPVGTKVLSMWDGSVTRVNWNHKFNGDSVELAVAGGKKARYLHLSEIGAGVKAGARVKVGQVLGLSGNTGRSFAPHLHYEVVDGNGRVLDPLKLHETAHRAVPAGDVHAFEAEVDRLRGLVEATVKIVPSAAASDASTVEAPTPAAATPAPL